MTAEIRPGIHRPDWSVVTKPAAQEALLGRDRSRFGLTDKWNQTLEPEQDRVWRTVLELFARSGRPPHLHEISKETGLSEENIRTLVSELQAHDLLGSNASADVILYAYPFTGQATEHRVNFAATSFTLSAQSMRSALPACLVRTYSLSLPASPAEAGSKSALPRAGGR